MLSCSIMRGCIKGTDSTINSQLYASGKLLHYLGSYCTARNAAMARKHTLPRASALAHVESVWLECLSVEQLNL